MRASFLVYSFSRLGNLDMSHPQEDFKDTTSAINICMVLVALVAMPLLPMLMGWFTLLR
tara:strand:+ start:355 stop:531 length:177 start_codon:yes stop_codon:yes gene_type:complete